MKRMLLVLPIGLLMLAGCGHTGTAGSGAANSLRAAEPAAGAVADSAGSTAASGSTASSGSAGTKAAASGIDLQQRDVVRTATVDVTVPNVDRAADDAVNAAMAAGGRADADDRNTDGSDRHAHLVLRVPATRLTALLDRVVRSGHENSRTDHGQDVTASSADIGARVAELRISVARLQDFLRKSGSIAELVSLENQLTQRQSDLQSTIAQQDALADQVTLATLTVDLSAVLPPAARQTHAGPPGFGHAILGSVRGLLVTLRVVLAAAGYLVPFLVVLVPIGFVLLWLRKRLHRTSPLPDQP